VALEIERWQWRELIASEHGPADPSTRLVLFVIALHMNQRGDNAFPSQATIARRTALSERSVRTHLARAAKAGWIQISQKRRAGQAYFVNQYVATIPDKLAGLCASKPWEDDRTWRRPEEFAGRSESRHPANGAQRAAKFSATPGNPFRDTRQNLPTNTPMNPPMNTPIERAALSRNTPLIPISEVSNRFQRSA
jgi:hypothetical protein